MKEKKSKELKQLKQKDLSILRNAWHRDQDGVCPLLEMEFHISEMVMDHQHMTKSETIGECGAGMCRGVIHRQVNSFEGKITNAYKRYGLDKFDKSLPDLLRNLADYLEQDVSEYIHPNEQPKEPKLMKSSYNKLKKVYDLRKKFPIFPKSGKLTKPLADIYDLYGMKPEYYKV